MTTAVVNAMRITGAAPCASKFDSLSSILTVGTIETARYEWLCGGSHADSSTSSQFMTGPVATFVFERPGTYTVTHWVKDEAGNDDAVQSFFVIDDFDAHGTGVTHHVANEGDDTLGDGSVNKPWKTVFKAMAVARAATANDTPAWRRIWLKAGQVHVIAVGVAEMNPSTFNKMRGPFHFGRYGTGPNPILEDQRDPNPNNTYVFHVNGRVTDWSFVDIDVRGLYTGYASPEAYRAGFRFLFNDMAAGPYARADLLFLRCNISKLGQGILAQIDEPGAQAAAQSKCGNIVIADTTIKDVSVVCAFGHFIDSGIVNSRFVGCDQSHILRWEMGKRSCLWQTWCLDPSRLIANGRDSWKLHGLGIGAATTNTFGRTEHVYATGCRFRGGANNVNISPQDFWSEQEVCKVIVDRCSFEKDTSGLNRSFYGCVLNGHDLTLRNCTFEPGPDGYAVGIETYPNLVSIPPIDNIYVDQCTARWHAGAGAGSAFLRPVNLVSTANVFARNNVAWAPSGSLSFISAYNPAVGTFNPLTWHDDGNVVTPADSSYVRHQGGVITLPAWQALGHAAHSRNSLQPFFTAPGDPTSPLISAISQLKSVAGAPALPNVRFDWLDHARTDLPIVGAHANQEDGGGVGAATLTLAEKIARNIVTTIETITVAAGYDNDISSSVPGKGGAQRVRQEGQVFEKQPTVVVELLKEDKQKTPARCQTCIGHYMLVVAAQTPLEFEDNTEGYVGTLVADIERALMADQSRGQGEDGGVLHTEIVDWVPWLAIEDGQPFCGANVFVDVQFRHKLGDPKVAMP